MMDHYTQQPTDCAITEHSARPAAERERRWAGSIDGKWETW